jgi:hypothetical protein
MLSVQPLTHFLARLEIGNALGINLYSVTSAGVSASATAPRARGESPETAQLNPPTSGQAPNNFFEKKLDNLVNFARRQPAVGLCQTLHKFGSDHVQPLRHDQQNTIHHE